MKYDLQSFDKSIIVIFALLLFTSGILAARQLTPVSLQLQWKHQFEYAGFYAAIEQGLYEAEGLKVELREMKSGLDPVKEVIEGRADMGIAYSSLLADYLQGKPVVMLANIFKHSALVILSQKELTSPSDLKGKRVMGSPEELRSWGLSKMLQHFGMNVDDVELVRDQHTIEAFVDREVDAMTAFISNEPYRLDLEKVPYTVHSPSNYGAQFYDINLFTSRQTVEDDSEKVQAFRRATIKGWEYALDHSDELIELILRKYNTQQKSRKALEYEAEVIKSLILPNIYEIGSIDKRIVEEMARYMIDQGMVSKDGAPDLDGFVFDPSSGEANRSWFSSEERRYLELREELRLCVDPNWMPFESIEDGRHIGMSAEYMKIIQERIDLPIRVIPTDSWTESEENIRERRCDMLSLVMETPERREFLDFTRPYLDLPIVIATTTDKFFIADLAEEQDKRFGIVRGYAIADILKRAYPGLQVVDVDSIKTGLEMVARGELFGFIDNLTTIGYQIQKEFVGTLKIAGQVEQRWKLGLGVRDDDPMLFTILDKVIESISEKERQRILNEWVSIKFEKGLDYTFLWQVLGLFMALFVLMAYRYQYAQRRLLQRHKIDLEQTVATRTRELRLERDRSIKAKEALEVSEARFRHIFEKTDLISVQGYDRERKVIYWNPASEGLYGYTAEEALGRRLEDLIIPEAMREEVVAAIDAWIVDGTAIPSSELILQKSDGSLVDVFSSHVLLHDQDGEPQMYCIDLDLTRLRTTEQELQEKEDIMIAQSRHAAMGEMISMIAHQWRQPLSVIAMSANNLLLDIDLEDLKEDAVEEQSRSILKQTQHLSRTIDDFRDFFKPDKKKEDLLLATVLEETRQVVGPSLKSHGISFLIKDESKSTLFIHKRELMQVLINLINNAKDAVMEAVHNQKEIVIRAVEDSSEMRIAVCDDGVGIDQAIITKIFDPYFSTKKGLNGTGLGLYMCKTIVEKHLDGHISVDDSVKGICFTIHLPKA